MTRINKRIFKSRKAVSPLIATVLLIAFAVALGAVVMNWGRGYVEDTANIARERSDSEVKCASAVDIDVIEIDGLNQICYNNSDPTVDNSTIYMIIENKKAQEIEKLQARLIGENTRVPFTIDINTSNLGPNEAKLMNFTYVTDDFGLPVQVKITPYIKVGASDIACPASAEVITTMKTCNDIWGD